TPLPDLVELAVDLRWRNYAVMVVDMAQIVPAGAAALTSHGAVRVAVVLGTSSSGIGVSEQAVRSLAEPG
ncbi:beta-ketoacyl-[acyl-carrier-protein] synthase II, partial [Stenotrophomonas maltophilia]